MKEARWRALEGWPGDILRSRGVAGVEVRPEEGRLGDAWRLGEDDERSVSAAPSARSQVATAAPREPPQAQASSSAV